MRRALEAKKYARAVEISAMDFSVRLGKPEVHRDMAAIFSLNHSCLFLIANEMSSVSDRSFFFQIAKISKIELPHKLIDCMSTEFCV